MDSGLNQPRSGHKRIACAESCEVQSEAGTWRGTVWNVSVVGAYVVLNPLPPVGQPLTLTFGLPGGATTIRVTSRVAWINPPTLHRGMGALATRLPPGCGVEFLDLDPGARARIHSQVLEVYPE